MNHFIWFWKSRDNDNKGEEAKVCRFLVASIACTERMCMYVGTPDRNDDQDAAEALNEVCESVCAFVSLSVVCMRCMSVLI